MQGPSLKVSTLHLIACLCARHANRVVVTCGGDTAWERADHRLTIQAGSIGTDEHLCLRAFLLNRMRVIYRALQQLVTARLELS